MLEDEGREECAAEILADGVLNSVVVEIIDVDWVDGVAVMDSERVVGALPTVVKVTVSWEDNGS